MKSSMVSRKPSGSNSAAAAASAMSTPPTCQAACRLGRMLPVVMSRLRAVSIRMATVSAAPIKLSQNGKKPGPGPRASDERVAERGDQGSRERCPAGRRTQRGARVAQFPPWICCC